jgi:hypothetical protein
MFDYLGFHFAYTMTVTLLSLRETHGELSLLQKFDFQEWDTIERLLVTH